MNKREIFELHIKEAAKHMRAVGMEQPYRVRVTTNQALEFGVSEGTKIDGVTVEVVDE